MTTFNGVGKDTVGPKYNFAMGIDDGSGTANMVGYVITKDTEWVQTTRLQDEGTFSAVASPNQIDRNLTYWPKVSQGDWSKGEEQLTYIDAQRYRSSAGVDVSKPGELVLYPSPRVTTFATTGSLNYGPLATEGERWFAGVYDTTNNFVISDVAGGPVQWSIDDGSEIYDLLFTPGSLYGGNASSIFIIGAGPPPTATLKCTAGIGPDAGRSLAYFDNKIFFITADGQKIQYFILGDTTPVDFQTAGAGFFEEEFTIICSTADGLFWARSERIASGEFGNHILYTYSGSDPNGTRIGDIWGKVVYAAEIYGITYVLCRLFQDAGHNDFTLYQIQGGQMTLVFDMRYVATEFRSTIDSNIQDVKAGLFGDGRFLFIAWPGMYGLRLDLATQGISRVGSAVGFGATDQRGHAMLHSSGMGTVDLTSVGNVITTSEYFMKATTGTLTFSDMDFDTPGEFKCFKGIWVELNQPLVGDASVDFTYAVDGSTSYLPTTQVTISPTSFLFLIPAKTFGKRISSIIELTADTSTGTSPSIRSVAYEATLGRVWKATVQCYTAQQGLDGAPSSDQGYDAQELLGNIENAYDAAARRVFLYVPSFTDPDQVEQVSATLDSYEYRGKRPELQGVVDLVFKEAP